MDRHRCRGRIPQLPRRGKVSVAAAICTLPLRPKRRRFGTGWRCAGATDPATNRCATGHTRPEVLACRRSNLRLQERYDFLTRSSRSTSRSSKSQRYESVPTISARRFTFASFVELSSLFAASRRSAKLFCAGRRDMGRDFMGRNGDTGKRSVGHSTSQRLFANEKPSRSQYLPPKGTAPLDRSLVNGCNLSPVPRPLSSLRPGPDARIHVPAHVPLGLHPMAHAGLCTHRQPAK